MCVHIFLLFTLAEPNKSIFQLCTPKKKHSEGSLGDGNEIAQDSSLHTRFAGY